MKRFGRNAGLPVVLDASLHGGADGSFEIGARHHDERIATAKFEDNFLDCSAAPTPT